MAYWVAYLVKAYSIPPILVENNDQIGVHLVLNDGGKTYGFNGGMSKIL
jgi:hypothetical protein